MTDPDLRRVVLDQTLVGVRDDLPFHFGTDMLPAVSMFARVMAAHPQVSSLSRHSATDFVGRALCAPETLDSEAHARLDRIHGTRFTEHPLRSKLIVWYGQVVDQLYAREHKAALVSLLSRIDAALEETDTA